MRIIKYLPTIFENCNIEYNRIFGKYRERYIFRNLYYLLFENHTLTMAETVEIEVKPIKELPELENKDPTTFVVEENTYINISYEDFFNKHMRNNVPCIIKNTGVNWESTKKWAFNNIIDFDYLTNQYGTQTVPVSDCKNLSYDFQPKTDMKFSDYLTYWKGTQKEKLLYLKDWHLRRNKPNDKFYTVPTLFGSDWLNEYAQDKQVDDFMFVYMGPAKTWTPMHADVYNSFSWSVNVSGKKKWHLFPPGQEEKLKDKFNNVVMQFEPDKFKDKNVVYYEIIQGKGDAIFVPSGWYHQVENEMDTISINHNWVNGTNLMKVWQSMTKTLVAVQKEIEQLKKLEEFPSLCQKMLKNLYGMDFDGFARLISHIGVKRAMKLNKRPTVAFSNIQVGKNHCLYDLYCINEVVKLMLEHHTYVKKEYPQREGFIVLLDSLKCIFRSP